MRGEISHVLGRPQSKASLQLSMIHHVLSLSRLRMASMTCFSSFLEAAISSLLNRCDKRTIYSEYLDMFRLEKGSESTSEEDESTIRFMRGIEGKPKPPMSPEGV